MLAAALIAARFVHYLATLALFGTALFPLYAFGRESPAPARLWTWLRTACAIEATLGLLSGAAWFALTAAAMADNLASAVDPAILMTVVRSTDFGPWWIARLGLIAVAIVISVTLRRKVPAAWTMMVVGDLALASLVVTGHAREPEGWRGALHMLADVIHLLAAGVWLGGLWPLGAMLAWASRAGGDQDVGLLLTRFSGAGTLAVAALVASGVLNSWFLVGDLGRLFTTPYGQLLLVKIGAFLVMAGLAAANRFWITPALLSDRSADSRWLARIRRSVMLEQGLGLVVIGVVSVLGTMQTAVQS